MLEFVFLAYVFGPVAAIPYALSRLGLDPLTVFVLLAIVYIAPLPVILKIYEFGGLHTRLYKNAIFKKFSETTNKQMHEVFSLGDEIQKAFEERLGHLGFYLAISVCTILFGIFWAAFFAYILKVEKIKAIMSIASGVLVGDLFWLIVTVHLLSVKTPIEFLVILLLIIFLLYGKKREKDVIKWIASRMSYSRKQDV